MKFRAHETFFIRKGWLSKGIKYVEQTEGRVFIDKENNPMDVLGIGSNMVKSLRYWLQAVGITYENVSTKRVQKFTDLGNVVRKYDRYIEELGTLLLLHYELATNKELATSWYVFFNEFLMSEFTQEDFLNFIRNYISMNIGEDEKESGTTRTLEDDFNCIVGTYVPRYKLNPAKVSAESNIDCPFGETNLIEVLDKKEGVYRKNILNASSFNPWITLALIQKEHFGTEEIQLKDLLLSPNSIGKVFNLDSITLLQILRSVEKLGEIKIIRTAGLDVIRIKHPEQKYIDCVNNYYESIASERT